MASRPPGPPLGLQLARPAHAVTRAFEQTMAAAGSSAAAWQVLVVVRCARGGTQAEMARVMGLTGATLSRLLTRLADGFAGETLSPTGPPSTAGTRRGR